MTVSTALERLIASFPSVLIGYSGGVDSALVAVVARRVLGRDAAVAAMGLSPAYPEVQRRQALSVARQFDLQLVRIDTHEMEDPDYAANSTNRCYFCKHELWTRLSGVAAERGIAVVADGTNADDVGEHRPGLRAAREMGIRSPLAEAGYVKDDVRREARTLGIPIWDTPAAPCLSSRIVYGLTVTRGRLRQVDEGEALLRALGVEGDLRVRHRGDEARIEVRPAEFARVREHRSRIADTLLDLGFDRVTLDLRGYRRGSLLGADEPTLEVLGARA